MARRGRSGEPTSERRAAILAAALDIFNAKGLAAATMDDIRAQSGASTGSIYHHFPGKEQLIAALYVEGYQALHADLRAAFAEAPAAAAGVRGIVAAYLGWFERNRPLGRFLLQAAGTEHVAAAAGTMLREAAELETLVLEWLGPQAAAGAVARLPAQLYIPLIIGPCREIVRRWQAGALDLAATSEPLAEAIWRSLAGDTP